MPEEKLEGVVEPLSEEVPATEDEQEKEAEESPAPEGTPAEAEPTEEVDELTALQQELEVYFLITVSDTQGIGTRALDVLKRMNR